MGIHWVSDSQMHILWNKWFIYAYLFNDQHSFRESPPSKFQASAFNSGNLIKIITIQNMYLCVCIYMVVVWEFNQGNLNDQKEHFNICVVFGKSKN